MSSPRTALDARPSGTSVSPRPASIFPSKRPPGTSAGADDLLGVVLRAPLVGAGGAAVERGEDVQPVGEDRRVRIDRAEGDDPPRDEARLLDQLARAGRAGVLAGIDDPSGHLER